MKVSNSVVSTIYYLIYTYHTPTIPVTVLTPGEVLQIQIKIYSINTKHSDILSVNRYVNLKFYREIYNFNSNIIKGLPTLNLILDTRTW